MPLTTNSMSFHLESFLNSIFSLSLFSFLPMPMSNRMWKMKILPPFRFFLCRLWRQQAISRILMSTKPVPDVIPISMSKPRDVFVLEPSLVSGCCVVNVDMDCCGGAEFPCSYEFACFSIVSCTTKYDTGEKGGRERE